MFATGHIIMKENCTIKARKSSRRVSNGTSHHLVEMNFFDDGQEISAYALVSRFENQAQQSRREQVKP
jgi:hypothetical protein